MLALDPVLGLQSTVTDGESIKDTTDPQDDLEALLDLTKPKKVSVTVDPPKTFFELVESKKDSKVLNRKQLRGFLNHYGVFPEKHRFVFPCLRPQGASRL